MLLAFSLVLGFIGALIATIVLFGFLSDANGLHHPQAPRSLRLCHR